MYTHVLTQVRAAAAPARRVQPPPLQDLPARRGARGVLLLSGCYVMCVCISI